MGIYGLSALEIKHLIERALLPDKCMCTIVNGYLTLNLDSIIDPEIAIQIAGIKMESLSSSRSIAELIGEARYRLAQESKGLMVGEMRSSQSRRQAQI
jgi:hypothetical protein